MCCWSIFFAHFEWKLNMAPCGYMDDATQGFPNTGTPKLVSPELYKFKWFSDQLLHCSFKNSKFMKYKTKIIELLLDFLQTVPWKCYFNQSQFSKVVKIANYNWFKYLQKDNVLVYHCTVCHKESKARKKNGRDFTIVPKSNFKRANLKIFCLASL